MTFYYVKGGSLKQTLSWQMKNTQGSEYGWVRGWQWGREKSGGVWDRRVMRAEAGTTFGEGWGRGER